LELDPLLLRLKRTIIRTNMLLRPLEIRNQNRAFFPMDFSINAR